MAKIDALQPVHLHIDIALEVPIIVDTDRIDEEPLRIKRLVYYEIQQAVADLGERLKELT